MLILTQFRDSGGASPRSIHLAGLSAAAEMSGTRSDAETPQA